MTTAADTNSILNLPPGSCERLLLDKQERANVLDSNLVERLHSRLDDIERKDEAKVLVVEGEGRSFCGGFDFGGYKEASQGDILYRFVRIQQFLHRLRSSRLLTIAVVRGPAFGAGADIVASCDIRIGTPRARFRFPGFRFGVALGTMRLKEIVGEDIARKVLLSSLVLKAEEAEKIGLVTALAGEEELAGVVGEWLMRALAFDTEALTAMKGLLRGPSDGSSELAALVASVARPGIHGRISDFLAENGRAR